MFGAVVAVVRQLASQGPVLMVVDDLHWADRSSLLLARHIAQEPALGTVLTIGTFRDSELQPGHPLLELLAELERGRGELLRLGLDGMDVREVTQLVGGDVPPGAAAAIHSETGGNPFFAKQLARHLAESGGARGVPDGVRDVIALRVARLSEHAARVLGIAALIGRDFDLELLERVADLPEDDLLDLLDGAVRGALLSRSRARRAASRSPTPSCARRSRASCPRPAGRGCTCASARRSNSSTAPGRSPGSRSWRATSPPPGRRALTVPSCTPARAAEQATGRLAYEEAARLLDAAAALRRSDPYADREELAQLEIALAAAQSDAGQWEAARASHVRAAGAAREAGAPDTFARAALGHAGGTWEQFGVEDAENVALIEEALGRLPAEDSPMRAQVLAKLAIHRGFVAGVPEAEVCVIADEAVAMARRVDDAQPLAAALTGALHARWRPGRATERLPLAAELIELTEAHEKLKWAADAHVWRAGALLELCRLDEADAHLARHAELVAAAQQPALQIHRDAVRTMRAALEGDYEHATRIARELSERGERDEAEGRLRTPIHAQIHGANLLLVLNERSELGPHTAFFERLAQQVAPPGWRPALAWAQAQAGRFELARELIEAMSADGFSALPRDSNFVPRLAQIAHAIGELRDAELAARVEPLLVPYDGLRSCSGPARRARSAPSPTRSGCCGCCSTGPRRRPSPLSRRSSARKRCGPGPTRRAHRPGWRRRCAAPARTSGPPRSRRPPPRPRASSA